MSGLGDKTGERLSADPRGRWFKKECVEKRESRTAKAIVWLRLRRTEMNSGGTS